MFLECLPSSTLTNVARKIGTAHLLRDKDRRGNVNERASRGDTADAVFAIHRNLFRFYPPTFSAFDAATHGTSAISESLPSIIILAIIILILFLSLSVSLVNLPRVPGLLAQATVSFLPGTRVSRFEKSLHK